VEGSCRSPFSAVVLAAYENWGNLLVQLITRTVFASGMVQLLTGVIFVPGLVQPISVTKFTSGMVVSRSPGVYFVRHRPHAKPENRLCVSIVFMTDMKVIRAFRDSVNVLKRHVEVQAAVMLKVYTLQQPV
jgi:hypothetical protein